MFEFSEKSKERMVGVNSSLIVLANKALKISVIDFGIPQYGGIRTVDEQYMLWDDGKSKCDGTDKKSFHQTGNALDFYAYVDGKASWEEKHLALVAAAFLQSAATAGIRLEWGGFWKSFRDMPHVQLVPYT